MFITFEGGEGSGKSSCARAVVETLRLRGIDVTHTREPGGSPGAEDIRRLLVEGEPGRWSAETELLLFTAARRDHLEKTIRPALDRGAIVICDRFVDSTRAIQGAARAASRPMVDTLHASMISFDPHLTLILDCDPRIGLARTTARMGVAAAETRFEKMGAEFHDRVRAGFLEIAAAEPGRCRIIDATQDAATVLGQALGIIEDRIQARPEGMGLSS